MAIKSVMLYYKCFYDCNVGSWVDSVRVLEAIAARNGFCGSVLARRNPLHGAAILLGCSGLGHSRGHYENRLEVLK